MTAQNNYGNILKATQQRYACFKTPPVSTCLSVRGARCGAASGTHHAALAVLRPLGQQVDADRSRWQRRLQLQQSQDRHLAVAVDGVLAEVEALHLQRIATPAPGATLVNLSRTAPGP